MDERIRKLRSLEPRQAGKGSYLAILEAAAGLFQQVPFEAIALKDIVTFAGVGNQTLYNYFPAGRDDVALMLQDRMHHAVRCAFNEQNHAMAWEPPSETEQVIHRLSASLARAVFSSLQQNRNLQVALHQYLAARHLHLLFHPHTELEQAFEEQIRLRLVGHFDPQKRADTSRLSVKVVQDVAERALERPEGALPHLESTARKLVRVLLRAGLAQAGQPSGNHELLDLPQPPSPIVGAPMSTAHRKSILARFARRKDQA